MLSIGDSILFPEKYILSSCKIQPLGATDLGPAYIKYRNSKFNKHVISCCVHRTVAHAARQLSVYRDVSSVVSYHRNLTRYANVDLSSDSIFTSVAFTLLHTGRVLGNTSQFWLTYKQVTNSTFSSATLKQESDILQKILIIL